MKIIYTDVLVIGAGLAGSMCAITAGKKGGDITIVSAVNIFSGSSFFPGTWGFGLVAPKKEEELDDLCETITKVGMNEVNQRLVTVFVKGIKPAIVELESLGINLMRPENGEEREFIPCFDDKTRDWYGIIQEDGKRAFEKAFEENNIKQIPQVTIVTLLKNGRQIIGAIGISLAETVVFYCKSCVIASGGLGGLFKHSLTTPDVCGMGQYLAIQNGGNLINMEYFQMMLGFLTPSYGTVFNEKVYRYSEFYDTITKENLLEDLSKEEQTELLEIRSFHGPFTSRLASYKIDKRIYENYLKNPEGVLLKYRKEIKENQPEFVKTYFKWLKEKKNITVDDEIKVTTFYHAANGGIEIDENCKTGVAGLFACGEVTGGMHGADRIGGLSTANGLVFGRIAGREAVEFAKTHSFGTSSLPKLLEIKDSELWLEKLQELNSGTIMIIRESKKIQAAYNQILQMEKDFVMLERDLKNSEIDGAEIINTYRLLSAIAVTKEIINQILENKESKGSHYRLD